MLAILVYVIFLSGLLAGDLFPTFEAIESPNAKSGFASLFAVDGDFQEYAKLVFWSFVAGFSEHFVIDIVNQFQSDATVQISEDSEHEEACDEVLVEQIEASEKKDYDPIFDEELRWESRG